MSTKIVFSYSPVLSNSDSFESDEFERLVAQQLDRLVGDYSSLSKPTTESVPARDDAAGLEELVLWVLENPGESIQIGQFVIRSVVALFSLLRQKGGKGSIYVEIGGKRFEIKEDDESFAELEHFVKEKFNTDG
ncbi:MAG: hypothetical protein AAFR71_10575 [Pseudomonadota bacterium]